MATDSQLLANRDNAQHSTGPRTAAGKANSARNAITLGLFTKRDYVRRRERAEYDELCARCVTELDPEGILEETLVASIVSSAWRLRRCALVEREHVTKNPRDPMADPWAERTQNAVLRARAQASVELRRATIELRRLQTDRALAKKLLAAEAELPPLVHTRQIVTAIDQHRRAQAPRHQQKSASFCIDEKQTPRNGPCPCGSNEKFKRCCGKDAPPLLGPTDKAA